MLKSEENFKQIYQENKSKVRSLIYNMTGSSFIDDLEQEVFIKVWDNLSLFSGKAAISTWIYRICHNTSIDHLRKNKLKPEEKKTETDPNQAIVQEALMKIDEDSRMILIMFYFDDHSIKEIAKILEIKEGTVKSRLFKARSVIGQELEGKIYE